MVSYCFTVSNRHLQLRLFCFTESNRHLQDCLSWPRICKKSEQQNLLSCIFKRGEENGVPLPFFYFTVAGSA